MKRIITLSHIGKTACFYFSFHNNISVFISLWRSNGVLFTQEIPKEIILSCIDCDVLLGQKMLKAKSNK